MNQPHAITQNDLDTFKTFFPNDPRIAALTLDEVLENTRDRIVDWSSLRLDVPARPLPQSPISPCAHATANVVFDAICVVVGGVGLRNAINAGVLDSIAEATGEALGKLEQIIADMTKDGASATDVAKGIFKILGALYSTQCLGAVINAFTASLTWWDMVLYAITAIGTILAVLATDGVAFVAEVILVIASAGFLVSDSVKAYETCSGNDAPPPIPSTGQFPNGQVVNPTITTSSAPAACAFNGLLYLFWTASDGTHKICYSTSTDDVEWQPAALINDINTTSTALAACAFNGSLYLFFRADDGTICVSGSQDGKTWSTGAAINAIDSSSEALTACAFNNALYVFWRANNGTSALYVSSSTDGVNFASGQPINNVDTTSAAPSACVYKGAIYLFWRANDPSASVYYGVSTDGATWPSGKRVNSEHAVAGAIGVCQDDTGLHLFWQENNSGTLRYGSMGSKGNWRGSSPINSTDSTSAPPAACTYNGLIYLFWKAADSTQQIYTSNADVPGVDAYPFDSQIALVTAGGNYLTVVNQGGLKGDYVAIQTNSKTVGPFEKFQLVPLDPTKKTFALMTANGNFVTAALGGGIGGPDDATCPVHTDATQIGPWEILAFLQQEDGTYALCTPAGYFLTATFGGGVGPAEPWTPVVTNTRTLGWTEIFTAKPLVSNPR